MSQEALYLGIDLGAGTGAKMGLFSESLEALCETELPNREYGASAADLSANLIDRARSMLVKKKLSFADLQGIGMASAGLFKSDGTYLLAANLTFLNGFNLRKALEDETGIPTGIENDANAGGLAEWKIYQTELFYWVFGGGWGGVWISKDGEVRFSSLDWDQDDASLHYSNEPGYAIPLDKTSLKLLFQEVGSSFERFEQILLEEFDPPEGRVLGPSGSPDHLRAEVILSGPGRCRLFRAIVGDDDFYERFLDPEEASQMSETSVAGRYISKLSSMRVEAAVNTDRLFGKVLALATRTLLKQARRDGARDAAPICLGGKPSYALPYFGPPAQRMIGKLGFMNYLRPSVIDERGLNANLVGAAVVAQQAARASS